MSRINSNPSRILVFDPLKRLVAIFKSVNSTAKAFKTTAQSIHYACTGRCISCEGLYFRHLQDDIEVTMDDLDELKLEVYDQLCGVERKVYKTKNMNRTGMKYKTNKKQ